MKTGKLLILTTAFLIICAKSGVADDKMCPMYKNHCKMGKVQYEKDWNVEEMFYKKARLIMMNEKELGLSAEQIKAIRDLKSETKKQVIRNDAEIDVIKVDIKNQLYEPTINIESVNALIDKKYDVKKAKAKLLVDSLAKLKAQLTEDQINKLKELYKQKMDD